jgi:hypothetical protein
MKAVKELVVTMQETWARHDMIHRSAINMIRSWCIFNVPHTMVAFTLNGKRRSVVAG